MLLVFTPTFTLENIQEISSTNDKYNNAFIKFTSGNNANEVRQISDYVGADRTVTVSEAFSNIQDPDNYQLFSQGNYYW